MLTSSNLDKKTTCYISTGLHHQYNVHADVYCQDTTYLPFGRQIRVCVCVCEIGQARNNWESLNVVFPFRETKQLETCGIAAIKAQIGTKVIWGWFGWKQKDCACLAVFQRPLHNQYADGAVCSVSVFTAHIFLSIFIWGHWHFWVWPEIWDLFTERCCSI